MNLCVPAPFPYATPLSVFILPYVSIVSIIYLACAFISVYATHIVPLPLSCNHYFHSTACTYKPLFSLYHSGSPAPLLLFFPGFVVSINIFLWLVHCTPLFPLSFLPCFPSQFCFNCHILCTTCYLPLLLALFVLFLFYFVRFIITCTNFLPFPCFIYYYPTVQSCLNHVDFALSVPLLSILALPYTFYCLSSFILSPIFSLSCLPFSSSSFLLLCSPVSFFASLSVHRCQPNENENRQDSKVSGEVPSPPYHSIVLKR